MKYDIKYKTNENKKTDYDMIFRAFLFSYPSEK